MPHSLDHPNGGYDALRKYNLVAGLEKLPDLVTAITEELLPASYADHLKPVRVT